MIEHLVSKNKRRYLYDDYEPELTYLTDKIQLQPGVDGQELC